MRELAEKLNEFTVLIVEDDNEIRKRILNTLSFYFKKVYESSDGIDGYESFLALKPDLLISDIEMPDGNGIELVKNIRKINSFTPIIVLSAYSKEEYLLNLINLNINQYILKPASNESLLNAISAVLLKENNTIFDLGEDLYLDMDNSKLLYKKDEINLRKKEKHFLELLHQNKNKIVNYDMIQDYIWEEKFMTQNALKSFVKELRHKLPVQIIDNIIQEGYKLKNSSI
jgi:DNA-binding response OmpR family regulator